MAMHIPKAPGLQSMIKEGAKYFEGVDDAVVSNIEACVELGKTMASIFGPCGMQKMVINHIGSLFVSNDAAICLRELEVAHPAAKMVVMASQEQEQEAGDGTNTVMQLACGMLSNAVELIKMGLTVGEIAEGYELGEGHALEVLKGLARGDLVKNLRDEACIRGVVKTAIVTKQSLDADLLAGLVTKACLAAMPSGGGNHFNVDNVRVCKVLGGGVTSSKVVSGMVFKREADSDVKKVCNTKVVVYSCPLDALQTETKGTIRLETAQELQAFSAGDERLMESHVRDIVEAGCGVVITGGKVGEMALHYANKAGLLVVRLSSKFDVKRLCTALGATALPRLTKPTAEECGWVGCARTEEVGDTTVVIFEQGEGHSPISTILLRGSTEHLMDSMATAVDDGVNTFKALTKDHKLVPGAGATEMEVARTIKSLAEKSATVEQYALAKYAESFEGVGRALAENFGAKAADTISALYAAHEEGKKAAGFVIEAGGASGGVADAVEANVMDLHLVKFWAIKYATTVACKILRVNQIIMAKPAGGGPKPKQNADWDE